jgi:hypothetical protein
LTDALTAHKPDRLVSLESETYNNVAEVKRALERLQIPIGADPNEPYGLSSKDWGLIAAMTTRRHRIAHRADRNDLVGQGHHFAKPIKPADFQGWVDTVRKLGNAIQQRL